MVAVVAMVTVITQHVQVSSTILQAITPRTVIPVWVEAAVVEVIRVAEVMLVLQQVVVVAALGSSLVVVAQVVLTTGEAFEQNFLRKWSVRWR